MTTTNRTRFALAFALSLSTAASMALPAAAQTASPSTQPAPREKTKKFSRNETLKEGQYTSETDAKSKCGSETVVWANFNTKVFHYAGHADYGHTKHGAYMCEVKASAGGFRAAKGEKKS